MITKARKRIFEILEVAGSDDAASRIFDVFIVGLISLNLIAVVLGTVESLYDRYGRIFTNLEKYSVIIFTIEYLLRIWTCTVNKKFNKPVSGRIRFALTPLLLVDLMAVLPFYLPMLIPVDLRFLRMLRLIRIFRAFKMVRYFESLRVFVNVFRAKKEDLVIAVFIIAILLVIASSLMYYIENRIQPKAFSSIPQSMWWGIATITTVGYGDVYPITSLGKFLGSMLSLLGIGMFALPTGIIASGFSEEMRRRRGGAEVCPHCGKPIK